MYMETNDWNNKFGTVKVKPYSSFGTNWSNGTVTYVSYKKIYFTFKIPSSETTCYDFVWVDLPSTNLSSTGITQVSNWNLSKVTLNDPTINTGGSGGSGGSSPTPTPDSSQAIINNQNQNTQSIIENQDNNTQDIISSIQETTQQVSETITNTFTNTCTNILDVSNIYQNNVSSYNIIDNGIQLIGDNSWQNVIYRLPVENGKRYYFSGNFTSQYENSIIISLSYNGNNPSDLLSNQFYNFDGSSSNTWSTDFVSNTNGYVYLGIWVTKGNTTNNASYLQMMFSPSTSSYCPLALQKVIKLMN